MTDQKIINLKEAKEQGLTHYFTGKPCKYGHVDKRLTKSRCCCSCLREREARPDRAAYKKKQQQYYMTNNESYIQSVKKAKDKYRSKEENRQKERYYSRIYRKSPAGRIVQERFRKSGKANVLAARRRSAKLQRTPSWLTDQHHTQIKEVYRLAKLFEKEYGVKYNVDHIVPLQGELVSGLHVPWNLMAITERKNKSKSNSFEV